MCLLQLHWPYIASTPCRKMWLVTADAFLFLLFFHKTHKRSPTIPRRFFFRILTPMLSILTSLKGGTTDLPHQSLMYALLETLRFLSIFQAKI